MISMDNCVTVTGDGDPVVLDDTQQRILHILGEDNVGILGCEGGIDSAAPRNVVAPAVVAPAVVAQMALLEEGLT
jgi:hypothetical protein